MTSDAARTVDPASLERENRRLQRAVQEMGTLNDLSRAIAGSLETDEIIATIIGRSLKAIGAEQGVITLLDSGEVSSNTLARQVASRSSGSEYHLSAALVGWMMLNQQNLVVEDPRSDPRFSGVEWDPAVRNLLCVPMTVKGALKAILAVYNKKDALPFDKDDERLLAIIAGQSAQVVENARLYEQEKMLTRMREQLRLAAEVQQHLLPSETPAIEDYEIAGTSIAAQDIGGDAFDYIPMSRGRWGISIADVSGKGIPASLLMSTVQAILRVLSRLDHSPSESLRLANQLICRCSAPEKFVTLFLSVLDPSDGSLIFTNAGHNPPMIIGADGSCRRLWTRGLVLGMFEDFDYGEERTVLVEGDHLVLFSDGISEALDEQDREFEEERLIEVVTKHRRSSAAQVLDAVLQAVRLHVGRTPQSDDITLVVVRKR